MPTTYAHDRFGREVWKKLPKELKETVRQHKKLYLIGLHGPDIFFYYHPFAKNPISEYGSRLHQQTAAEFFRERISMFQERPDDAMRVYLLGFACHFLLDSTCHPYINAYENQTGISHAEIETHLDRELMEMDGKDPFRYEPACSICPDTDGNRVIQRCFPKLSQEEILECLKGMKFYTHSHIVHLRTLRCDGRTDHAEKAESEMRDSHQESPDSVPESGGGGSRRTGGTERVDPQRSASVRTVQPEF